MCTDVMLFTGGTSLTSMIDIAAPYYCEVRQLERFRDSSTYKAAMVSDKREKELEGLNDQQIDDLRKTREQQDIQNIVARSIGAILHNLSYFLVSLLLFAIHWHMFKRNQERQI